MESQTAPETWKQHERWFVGESADILSGATRIPTFEHLLALRNAIAGAYRLIDMASRGESLDASEVRAWQRVVHPVLDARVK